MSDGSTQLTYEHLNQAANRLAHHLRAYGVGPEILVSVLAERGAPLLIAILAIFKSGRVYVPFEPRFPAQRLSQMFGQSRTGIVLVAAAQRSLLTEAIALLPAGSAPDVLDLDQLLHDTSPACADLPPYLAPNSLACVIFTSGTTGVPKGAMIEQRGMLNHLSGKIAELGLTGADIVAQNASQCFVISIWQLLAALAVGGRVQICEDAIAHDAAGLLAYAAHNAITILEVVPSLLRSMLEVLERQHQERQAFPALRWLVPTGEALPPELARRWLRLYPNIPLLNAFGSSECSDDVAHHSIERVPDEDLHYVPIGRPIANTSLYVLDPQLQPVPSDVAGYLYVGGISVGRGYLHDPALTAVAFIPDPFAAEPGARLYNSGDLARYQGDGALVFLGRDDYQVKVRGFRIEIGEIEAVIEQHPLVRAAVMAAREDRISGQRLVAYIVATTPELAPAQVRRFVEERLPEYMAPSAVVMLDALPLTPNGKVDRKALPAPTAHDYAVEGPGRTPTTPIERQLSAIFSAVLGIGQVDIEDHFFKLGGNSLSATMLILEIRERFGVELALPDVFETPTIAGLSECVAAAAGQSDRNERELPGLPVLRPAHIPLSFAQQRLWFLDQLGVGREMYTMTQVLRFTGALQVALLERSLEALLQRHEILRTHFSTSDGQPVQVIAPGYRLQVPLVDLSDLEATTRAAEIWRQVAAQAAQAFNLAVGPLLRVTLLRIAANEHLLIFAIHHSIFDGWSIAVLLRELLALYNAFATAQDAALPALPIQYADFTLWQHQQLTQGALADQQVYWRQQLDGAPLVLDLPADRLRPAIQTFRGAREPLSVPRALTAELDALSRQANGTLFMTLLASLGVAISRYTGQSDMLIGTTIANRTFAAIGGLIGFFANTIALRIDLAGNPAFSELLARVRRTAIAAYEHQEYPFERLVQDINPKRDLSRTPLVQVLFVLQNADNHTMTLPGLHVQAEEVFSETAKFDLTIYLEERDQELSGHIEYYTDIFDRERIARFAGHFQTLLEGVIADPRRRLADLPLLTAAEQRQLQQWNATSHPLPPPLCLHELVTVQVRNRPDAVAVAFEDQQLTYQELDRRVNQLARHLRARGVGPEQCVGICLERSLELIIAILATLKAGGAYMPLDPGYPPQRLAFMIEDARAVALLTQKHLRARLPGEHPMIVSLDADWGMIARLDGDEPAPAVTGMHLATIIYTSGSTGQPKGTLTSHAGLHNRLCWIQHAYALNTSDRVLHKTPITFDVSIWELFWPLMVGARMVVARPGGHRDSTYLVRTISAEQITILHFVPSLLQILLEEPNVGACTSIRRIICSGEALSYEIQERCFARLDAALHNLYGPTEASIDVTYWDCERATPRRSVPIGRPIANTQIYLLDRWLNPVPVGVPGNLYIGGVGLSRGYLNQPALTAERFIPNPFSLEDGGWMMENSHPDASEMRFSPLEDRALKIEESAVEGGHERSAILYPPSSSRLYRTGDLAYYLPDGAIEFLGRDDYQVKVRGLRIELGEIEAVLLQHPLVRAAAVVAHDLKAGDQRLVAYITGDERAALTLRELRAFLQERLPEYMLPAFVIPLDTLPLTSSGKVDRRALPAPDGSANLERVAFVEPQTPLEEVLAGIWAGVLELDRVGIEDNFFELGGHSLLAVQVISRIREFLQVDLALQQFFAAPTVASLAEELLNDEAMREQVMITAPVALQLAQLSDAEIENLLASASGEEEPA